MLIYMLYDMYQYFTIFAYQREWNTGLPSTEFTYV